MIQGYFGDKGELYFEIDLIAADGSVVTVDALLDTGFTDWIAMDIQDVDSLGWSSIRTKQMRTARGDVRLNVYEGIVVFASQELTVPVLGGSEIQGILLGLPWLENRRLIVDRKAGLMTILEE